MSEHFTPPPPEVEKVSLNNHLGIPEDGAFIVKRSDGTQDSGWSIDGVLEVPGANDGVPRIKIKKTSPDGKGILYKIVGADTLMSWQDPIDAGLDNNELINGVPGMSSSQNRDSLESIQPSHEDRVVPNVNFRGDVTKVPGHPSNPNNEALQALADQLNQIGPPS